MLYAARSRHVARAHGAEAHIRNDRVTVSPFSAFNRFLCTFDRHRPVRQDVTWGGVGYVGACKYCGSDIVRSHEGVWRRDLSGHSEK
jgi:hypothetical protein